MPAEAARITTPAEVAAMGAEEALDAWTAFITKPK
jgi:hypothetical protein